MKSKHTLALCFLFAALQTAAQNVFTLRINEIMTSNIDVVLDPTWNYGQWIEIYNPSTQPINLKGLWLSDDETKLCKWRINHDVKIPSRGCGNLWFGHHSPYYWPNQIPGKMDCDGGSIILSNEAGRQIDRVDYPEAIARCSYARRDNKAGNWGYTSTPTPEASNAGIELLTERLEAPDVTPSEVFNSRILLQIDIPEGATLRYTMDGSTPTLTNGRTSETGTLSTTMTRIYRFALFKDGYLPSPVVTRSFIKRDKNYNIPIVSVVSDPKHFYDSQLGVFLRGSNGRRGKGTSEYCNWNQDWDRPVNFEMFHPKTGEQLINMETHLSRCGGHSKGFTPYSFKIKANKIYEGQNTLNYQFFDDQPYLKYKALQFRCGGNDYMYRMKDAALQTIVRTSGLDIDLQNYAPVCHFFNGEYMGTINMRETHNKHHVYAHYGLDEDEIDMYEIDCDSCYVQTNGTRDAWNKLYKLSANAANASVYAQIKNLVDVDELCNYMAVKTYLCDNDWPQNNQQGWRPRMENGKFRFILYDLDLSLGQNDPFSQFAGRQWWGYCELFDVPGVSHYTREVELVPIFMNLLKNDEFRHHFVDAFSLVAGSVFNPDRARKLVNGLVANVEYIQTRPSAYPGRNNSPRPSADEVINDLATRAPKLYDILERFSQFKVSGTRQDLELSANIASAQLQVNGQMVPLNTFSGRVYLPTVLQASAPMNQRFVGWRSKNAMKVGVGETLVPMNAVWKYNDKGTVPANWRYRIYSDNDWKEGTAPLGYGSQMPITTTVGYGGDANNKYPTTYFRHTFTIDKMPTDGEFILNYLLDDGFIIYINGKEGARVNMPQSAVGNNTYSSGSVSTVAESGSVVLDPALFKEGENLLAVEVHNCSATSSDICWDASLSCLNMVDIEAGGILSTSEQFELPKSPGIIQLEAVYEPLPEEEAAKLPRVVINEVSAANSIFVNEYFKRNDWIELYNTTADDIDLEGMYLSDNINKPHKFQISANGSEASTIIPAGGYAVVWCDKLTPESQLHTSFKLENADSTAVILTAADGSWADTLVYCTHDGMETVGRFPDGGRQLYKMYRPSIGKPNHINSYTTPYSAPHIEGKETGIDNLMADVQNSGGMHLHFANGDLVVKTEDFGTVNVFVTTLDGQQVMQKEVQISSPSTPISLLPLARGSYVAHAQDEHGNHCAVKFVK